MPLDAISSPDAPAAIGPYSQAIVSSGLVFTSGQIPLDPRTGELVSATVEAATHQVLRNLEAVLRAAGCSLRDTLKTTVFLTRLEDFTTVNAVYAGYFPSPAPARSTVQVAALPRGALLEIELVARIPASDPAPATPSGEQDAGSKEP